MKKGRAAVLAIAAIAAIGAAWIASNMVSDPEVRTVEKTVDAIKVLVASQPIKLGEAVNAANLKWQQWPKGNLDPALVTDETDPGAVDKFSGMVARAPFVQGEPISATKLVKLGEGGMLAAVLPGGKRAVSTPINNESAVSGFILPNDRVDVILSRRMDVGSKSQQVAETILSNIRVLAIGQSLETAGEEKTLTGGTATLELSPRQSEILALAQSMGQLSLSLRSLADASPKNKEQTAEIGNEDGSSVKLLKYGVPSRVFGIN
jgi:pilus assembly protein CpaB